MVKSFFTVAIGASAGGLPALIEFFDHFPPNDNVAFIIVTHLMRDQRSLLDEILSKHTPLPVIRVENDRKLEAGKIYLLVENTTLRVIDGQLRVSLRDSSLINSSVNILFESLASDFREKGIGIILSGGGDDGLEGAQKITEFGGRVMVQDPKSAQVGGMPSAVINGDHPTAILTPSELAQRVMGLCSVMSRHPSAI